MSGGGALNLSLLSRGIGEVQTNGHEKVEVVLEPSDYFNFVAGRPNCLPPLQSRYHLADSDPSVTTRCVRDGAEISLPKTFTTRKGALLLFSEDLALRTKEQERQKKSRRHHPLRATFSPSDQAFNEQETAIVMKTVDDLAKSILQYGGSGRPDVGDDQGRMYLKFIHRRQEQWERQMRPGYSAKRYLSTWTRTWDDQVFDTVLSKGYLTERSLLQYRLLLPNLRRHFFHEDLSVMPQPYRLMKNMLLTPGSLAGYTFYRVPADLHLEMLYEEPESGDDVRRSQGRPDSRRSIRVVRTTKEGQQEEVRYASLDQNTQKDVITDLLVKSAVHYALSMQEELYEESVALAWQKEQTGAEARGTPLARPVPSFDMRDAVDSLLDTHRGGPFVLGGDLPDVDTRSQSSDHTSSFKGSSVPSQALRPLAVPRGSISDGFEDSDRELLGDASSQSSIPQLPPVTRTALSPIKDVSRETSQLLTLPPIHRGEVRGQSGEGMPTVHVMPPTPLQHSLMAVLPSIGGRDSRVLADAALADVSGYNFSNGSSPRDVVVTRTQPSNRRDRSKAGKLTLGAKSLAAASLDYRAGKGSMIMAPDGEIISVGGSVVPPRAPEVFSDVARQFNASVTDESGLSDNEPGEWGTASRIKKARASKSLSRRGQVVKKDTDTSDSLASTSISSKVSSSVTEQDVLDTLTENAKLVAHSVLSNKEAGQDLETDVRNAADMWMEAHPTQDASRTQSAQDAIKPGAWEDILNAQRSGSDGPTTAEYRELIRQSLTTAVAKAAGLDPELFPEDADISAELLEALATQKLRPDDIILHHDQHTGRLVLRSRAESALALGGVAEGQLIISPDGGLLAGSISADRVSLLDSLDNDVISYKGRRNETGELAVLEDVVTSVVTTSDAEQNESQRKLLQLEKGGDQTGDVPSKLLADLERQGADGKTGAPQKSEEAKKKEEPFVVGRPKDTGELALLYGSEEQAASKPPGKMGLKKGKKQKGKKGKKEKEPPPDTETELTDKTSLAVPLSEPMSSQLPPEGSPELKAEDNEMEFIIIRENTSPVPEAPVISSVPLPEEEEDEVEEEGAGDDAGDDDNLRSISNREARAAKRAAAAAKRREEVERRRKEREEQIRREKEEQERQEQLRREMETERLKREEDRRLRKLQEAEEADREAMAKEEAERKKRLAEEKERKAREEYQRKLEELRRQQMEEDAKRMEQMLQREREEEERRAQEELMLSQMAEQERLEYQRKKRDEEEERKRKEEETRKLRELEAGLALQEARRLAEEMARKQALLEARLRFNRSLRSEARGLDHSQDINRAFVFSYFELLRWLGLDIPEFQMAKLSQF